MSITGSTSDTYRICLQGHVADAWSEWFDGFAINRHADGTTMLVGPVVDQAALHGLLARIRDLGLTILSVSRLGDALVDLTLGDRGGDEVPP